MSQAKIISLFNNIQLLLIEEIRNYSLTYPNNQNYKINYHERIF